MSEMIICSNCGRPYPAKGKPEGLSASKAAIGGVLAGTTGAVIGAAMGDRPTVTQCPYCGASAYSSKIAMANSHVNSSRPTPPNESSDIISFNNYITVNHVTKSSLPIDRSFELLKQRMPRDEWREWGVGTENITFGYRVKNSSMTSYCVYYDLKSTDNGTRIQYWTDSGFKYGTYSHPEIKIHAAISANMALLRQTEKEVEQEKWRRRSAEQQARIKALEEKEANDTAKQEERQAKRKKSIIAASIIILAAIGAAVFYFAVMSPAGKADEYQNALALMDSGQYVDAAAIFRNLGDYEESSSKADAATEKARAALFEGIKAGDTIELGHYEQDGDIENGSEPIEWRVLDLTGDKALLLSEYALDCSAYNDSEEKGNGWDTSSLRSWLTSTFGAAAFTDGERYVYLTDSPFCLSESEVNRYHLSSSGLLTCRLTAYAVENNPRGNSAYKAGDHCIWWLRQDVASTGNSSAYGPCVWYTGTVFDVNARGLSVTSHDGFVRPAIWVQL